LAKSKKEKFLWVIEQRSQIDRWSFYTVQFTKKEAHKLCIRLNKLYLTPFYRVQKYIREE